MEDKDIRITKEHPEADIKHIVKGIVRRGLKPVASKASISLRVDRDVLEWFKAQGAGYQSRMNAVLRAFKEESVA
ncbi:MAG: BrnA antitoxin family protein [Thermodesulfobacteriota bacterium]